MGGSLIFFLFAMIANRQDDGRYIFSIFRFEACSTVRGGRVIAERTGETFILFRFGGHSAVEAIADSEETGGILFFPFWKMDDKQDSRA
jgi:hypothetical protein